MSKIGQKTIDLENVQATIEEGGDYHNLLVKISGPKGELAVSIRPGIKVKVVENKMIVERANDITRNKAMHGLYRSLLANMVLGVNKGFEKKLEIVGVGYRGAQVGEAVELSLGFSHKITYNPPAGITLKMVDENNILISGADKQKVGQVAAEIRILRKPEPYKGKGIRYLGEHVKRKAGKTSIK